MFNQAEKFKLPHFKTYMQSPTCEPEKGYMKLIYTSMVGA